VRYRYGDYPVDLLRQLLTFQELTKLFLQLVLQTGGDVEEALTWMKYLQERGMIDPSIDLDEFRKELEKKEVVEERDGKLALSAAGERQIRRSALEEIFTSLTKAGPGYHAIPRAGAGGELLPETRPYEFGDNPTAIDGVRTIGNAVRRDADEIALQPEDFEVHEEEHLTSCATVLAIDISHSMILYGEDRFTPAKKVALAMVELIQSKYPKDSSKSFSSATTRSGSRFRKSRRRRSARSTRTPRRAWRSRGSSSSTARTRTSRSSSSPTGSRPRSGTADGCTRTPSDSISRS